MCHLWFQHPNCTISLFYCAWLLDSRYSLVISQCDVKLTFSIVYLVLLRNKNLAQTCCQTWFGSTQEPWSNQSTIRFVLKVILLASIASYWEQYNFHMLLVFLHLYTAHTQLTTALLGHFLPNRPIIHSFTPYYGRIAIWSLQKDSRSWALNNDCHWASGISTRLGLIIGIARTVVIYSTDRTARQHHS